MVSHSHPNGLVLELPAELSVVTIDDGFWIRPADFEDRRAYDRTRIRLVGRAGLPLGEWPQRRELGDVAYRYRTESVGGGSGGEEWELIAYAEAGDRFILCVHHTQVELAEPDFEPAWRMLAGVRLATPAPSPRSP